MTTMAANVSFALTFRLNDAGVLAKLYTRNRLLIRCVAAVVTVACADGARFCGTAGM